MSARPSAMPDYGLAHDLLNQLMILIGECDLLSEEFLEYRVSKHLHLIREIAVSMSKRIAEYQGPTAPQIH